MNKYYLRQIDRLFLNVKTVFYKILIKDYREIYINGKNNRAKLICPVNNRLDYIQKWSKRYDYWLPVIMNLASKYYPEEAIIDIGANIGDSVIAARLHGCNAKIIAIEPSPHFLKYLYKNLESNNQNNDSTQVVEGIVVGRSKNIKFSLHRTGTGKTERKSNEVQVEDEIQIDESIIKKIQLTDLNVNQCSFLKIDTDGFDAFILEGSQEWLDVSRPIIWAETEVITEEASLVWQSVLFRIREKNYNNFILFDNEGAALIYGEYNKNMVENISNLIDYSLKENKNYENGMRLSRVSRYYDIALFPQEREGLYKDFIKLVKNN